MYLLDNLGRFVIDNNIFSLIIAGTVSFAFSNLIKSFKINIIDYHIISFFHLSKSSSNIIIFLTNIFEFLFILLYIFHIYTYFFKKIIDQYTNNKISRSEADQATFDTLLEIATNTANTATNTKNTSDNTEFIADNTPELQGTE